jgi:glycosyltransferase involved in cell wall biosynthesis
MLLCEHSQIETKNTVMKIALVSPWPPEASGIANYAVFFKQALESAGVEVINAAIGLHEAKTIREIEIAARGIPVESVDVVHFELGGGRIRHFLLLEQLLRIHPDMIVTATVHDPERLAWRGWGLSRFESLPRLLQQAITVLTDPYSLAKERQLACRLNRIAVLTHGGGDALIKRMRIPHERVCVIPHGGEAIPNQPPALDGPLRLLFFGFLYPGKGIEDLIEALRLARQEGYGPDNLQLSIAGGARPTMLLGIHANYVASINQRIIEAGLADQAEVITDIPDVNIASLYQDHHALILPYVDSRKISLLGRFLGSSGPLSWAIACGRGALVSDARSLPEEVASGNGAVFRQQNPRDLANWMIRLANDRAQVMAWAKAAEVLAKERTWEAVGRQFFLFFNAAKQGS